jgi:tRNA(fMet)-specific endonuclease VapC
MSIRYLLDTNIVSYHIRRSSPSLLRRLHATPIAHVALSVVTEMELRYGLARNPALRIAPLVESFLSGIAILPLDSSVAKKYAAIRHAVVSKGASVGPLDLMIAAHALAMGIVLITNNTREFSRIPDLRCEDWSK